MAITLVGVAEASAINGADATITLPLTLADNDVVYVIGGHGRTASDVGVSTSGYTELIDTNHSAGLLRGGVSRKIMGVVPDLVATGIGSANNQDAVTYVAVCLRGEDTTTPEDATTTSADGDSNAPNSPSIVTVTDGAWVISGIVVRILDAAVTIPSGYGNQVDISADDTRKMLAGAATIEKTTAGTEDPGAWSNFASAQKWIAFTFAVRPAGVAAAVGHGRLLLGERNRLVYA